MNDTKKEDLRPKAPTGVASTGKAATNNQPPGDSIIGPESTMAKKGEAYTAALEKAKRYSKTVKEQ